MNKPLTTTRMPCENIWSAFNNVVPSVQQTKTTQPKITFNGTADPIWNMGNVWQSTLNSVLSWVPNIMLNSPALGRFQKFCHVTNKKSFIKIREIKHQSSEKMLMTSHLKSSESLDVQRFDLVPDDNKSEHDYSQSKHEETKMSTQRENEKNDWFSESRKSSNLGELQDTNKSDYIKAIFEIVKVDKSTNSSVKLTKHRHVISHCPHTAAQYYAKGMWKKWYFSRGQLKKLASNCIHKNAPHYATGMCKLWYLKKYHQTHERKRDRRSA